MYEESRNFDITNLESYFKKGEYNNISINQTKNVTQQNYQKKTEAKVTFT